MPTLDFDTSKRKLPPTAVRTRSAGAVGLMPVTRRPHHELTTPELIANQAGTLGWGGGKGGGRLRAGGRGQGALGRGQGASDRGRVVGVRLQPASKSYLEPGGRSA